MPIRPLQKILLLFNPQAGGGKAASLLPAIEHELVQQGLDLETFRSTTVGSIREWLSKKSLTGFDAVLAAGGDGTVFEAVNGLMAHPVAARPPLGVLPIGTGNAFCRDLQLQGGDWKGALALILRAETRQLDLAQLDCAEGRHYFLNIAGMGLVVDAGQTASKLKSCGKIAYTLAALWQALRLKSFELQIEVDGKTIKQPSLFLEISNSRYTGTSFLMAPAARLDDGLLDLTLLRDLSRVRLLRLFRTIYSGRHIQYPEVTVMRGREFNILQPAGSPMMIDGELLGITPARIRCLPGELRVFARIDSS